MRRAGLLGAATLGPAACSSDDDGADPGGGAGGTGGGGTGGTGGGGDPTPRLPMTAFAHGVASGDPLPDAVILWTRVSPELLDGAASGPVTVSWQIATDPELRDLVAEGELTTDEARDFTVKVDATGLQAATTYYYRFFALDNASPVGRTRTAPSGAVDRLRFAVCSCASFPHGYYHAYRHMGEQPDLDAIIHLGDYIYEYGLSPAGVGEYGEVRPYEPEHEIVTLEDYRTRYKQYRRDPALQLAHQQHPFIVIWDDHEITDNAWKDGAENHQPQTEGSWEERKRVAYQAYAEWLPFREQSPGKIWRTLRYGELLDLILLDTRNWGRDEQDQDATDDPERSLLGFDQEMWASDELRNSSARWRIVGQQVMMMNQPEFVVRLASGDAWDGYRAARERFLNVLASNAIDNVVVLTGDIHMSWAGDLVLDPYGPGYDPATGAGSLGVEMICPGVSSPGSPVDFQQSEPHIFFVDPQLRGYFVLDVTPERTEGAWWLVQKSPLDPGSPLGAPITVEDPDNYNLQVAAVFATADGANHLVAQQAAAEPRPDAPALAPPPSTTSA